jgi:hypothetical protein
MLSGPQSLVLDGHDSYFEGGERPGLWSDAARGSGTSDNTTTAIGNCADSGYANFSLLIFTDDASEFVQRLVLNTIADDFESVDQTILRDVARSEPSAD